MRHRYAILEAPSALGHIPEHLGVERAPGVLLEAGLAEGLNARRAGCLPACGYSSVPDPRTKVMNPQDAAQGWNWTFWHTVLKHVVQRVLSTAMPRWESLRTAAGARLTLLPFQLDRCGVPPGHRWDLRVTAVRAADQPHGQPQIPDNLEEGELEQVGTGSGVIMDAADGSAYILTNILLIGLWALMGFVLPFVLGYALQYVGHLAEGNDLGEWAAIKRLLGLPYVGIAPRWNPEDPDRL